MSKTDFHALTISRVRSETADTASFFFAIPGELKDIFTYQAGQYLTLRFVIDGKEERRAYSMCSSPLEEELAVSVKRLKGGIVSNHLNDYIKAGTTVDVMPPQGRFLAQPDPDLTRDIYLFGAGSGITPLYSILKTFLEAEPRSRVNVLYGNRTEKDIIFHDELTALEERYAGQLFLEHHLTAPENKQPSGLRKLWRRAIGRGGNRINGERIREFLAEHPTQGDAGAARYFICGPGGLIETVELALLGTGIKEDQIATERFTTANDVKETHAKGTVEGAEVTAILSGKETTYRLKPGQSVLDGLLEAGELPPYSCLAGACSTCMAKVVSGGVTMDACFALDADEVADGFVLTCQSHPTSKELVVSFDV